MKRFTFSADGGQHQGRHKPSEHALAADILRLSAELAREYATPTPAPDSSQAKPGE